MNLGGPVWHCSASSNFPMEEACRRECFRQLDGLGVPTLGEWHEWTGKAYHIRRRLSAREQINVGPVVDIRGTPEAVERLQAMTLAAPNLPGEFWRFALQEIGAVRELGMT